MAFKGNEKLKVDQKWWRKHKPITLKPTGLGQAMKAYDRAKIAAAAFAAQGQCGSVSEQNNSPIDAARKSLKDLETAVTKAKGKCHPKTHKHTIAVLNTVSVLKRTEETELGQLEAQFNTLYVKNVLHPLINQAEDAAKDYAKWKSIGHTLMKTVERDHNAMDGVVNRAKQLEHDGDKNGMHSLLQKLKVRNQRVQVAKKQLDKLSDKADGNLSSFDRISQDSRLALKDKTPLLSTINKIRLNWNSITSYKNKVDLMVASIQSSLNELKKIVLGEEVASKRHFTVLNKAESALCQMEEDGRKLVNTMTEPTARMDAFLAAQQAADDGGRPIEDVAKEHLISDPPHQWRNTAQRWFQTAKTSSKKMDKLFRQAKQLKEKTLATIPQGVLASPKAKEFTDGIDEYLQKLRDYSRDAQNHLTAMTPKVRTLR